MQSLDITTIAPSTRAAIRRALARWYAKHQRLLPWRQNKDPYAVWVSEAMLQQTQVQTVIPYYKKFMAQFPSVAALARSDQQAVLKAWEGLGYYSRARNLHRAARMVMNQMDGRIPTDWQGIRMLPGIGDYMAAAILSIAHGLPFAVADGNVKRVVSRLFRVDTAVNAASGHQLFQHLAQQLLDVNHPGDHNQGMMELGALVCIPKTPHCKACPAARYCHALKNRVVHQFPRRLKRAPIKEQPMAAGVVMKRGRYLLVRRPDAGLLGGMWEFPTAPLTKQYHPAKALSLSISHTTGLMVSVHQHVAEIRHTYTHFKIHLHVYKCRWLSGRVHLKGPVAFRWVAPSRLKDFPIHGAMHKIVASL